MSLQYIPSVTTASLIGFSYSASTVFMHAYWNVFKCGVVLVLGTFVFETIVRGIPGLLAYMSGYLFMKYSLGDIPFTHSDFAKMIVAWFKNEKKQTAKI